MKVHVNYTVEVPDEHVKKFLAYAEEMGYDYNDAGKQNILRRLFTDQGIGSSHEIYRTEVY